MGKGRKGDEQRENRRGKQTISILSIFKIFFVMRASWTLRKSTIGGRVPWTASDVDEALATPRPRTTRATTSPGAELRSPNRRSRRVHSCQLLSDSFFLKLLVFVCVCICVCVCKTIYIYTCDSVINLKRTQTRIESYIHTRTQPKNEKLRPLGPSLYIRTCISSTYD
jgi:Na+/melibiose symporter-like transporter